MITDIDKKNVDRSSPMPNVHDQIDHSSLMAKGTNSVNYVTHATNLSEINPAKNGQFTIVQSGSFTLNSNITLENSPGTGNFASFRAVTIATIPHNLPFTPIVTGSVLSLNGTVYREMPHGDTDYNSGAPSALWHTMEFAADSTYIYLLDSGMVWGGGWNLAAGWAFKYFCLYQTSN